MKYLKWDRNHNIHLDLTEIFMFIAVRASGHLVPSQVWKRSSPIQDIEVWVFQIGLNPSTLIWSWYKPFNNVELTLSFRPNFDQLLLDIIKIFNYIVYFFIFTKMLFWHKLFSILMIYALLLRNFFVTICALFPSRFQGGKAVTANLSDVCYF